MKIKVEDFSDDTLTLKGQEIPVKIGLLPHTKLKFYPDNPRIYSIVYSGEKTPSQEEIEERLSQKEYVRVLLQSIKANGGLTDPLIVRAGDLVVLEGNSRLAAYRMLSKKDPARWAEVKCKILPEDISDDLVFTLLGEYHIIGRTDWQPYEQAGYLYRRHKVQNVAIETIQKELGLNKTDVSHLIEVYSFMIKHNDTDINRWSYYEEYLKSNYIKRVRKKHEKFDKLIVKKIKTGEIKRAVEVRNKLVPIARSSPKILKKFISGQVNFEKSYERAIAGGAGNVIYGKLHRFREWLADTTIDDEIYELDVILLKKCTFEIVKIVKRLGGIIKKIENQ